MVIAVVEDDKRFMSRLSNLLRTKVNDDDSLILFSDGIRLLNHLEDENRSYMFDLIILDIKMPVFTGIEIASAIRNYAPDAAIVYLSNYSDYSLEAISTRPLDYLLKTDQFEDKLLNIIEEVRYRICTQDHFTVRYYSTVVNLPLGGISYIESQRRKIIIHFSNKEYVMYCRINDVEKELSGKGFIRVHRSYIVNTLHIVGVDRTRGILYVTGKQFIYVSPQKIPVVFDAFYKMRKRSYNEHRS